MFLLFGQLKHHINALLIKLRNREGEGKGGVGYCPPHSGDEAAAGVVVQRCCTTEKYKYICTDNRRVEKN